MTGFSQPERRGLERTQTAPGSHPDADLLSAFSEHSLSAREQEQVLAHLAACPTCRDVVVLAGSQLVEPVPEPLRQRGLWETPLFHWGAAAATAIVVVFAIAVGVRDYQPLHKTAATQTFNEVAPPAPATVTQAEADKATVEPKAKQSEGTTEGASAPQTAQKIPAPATTTTTRNKHLQEQFRYERPAEEVPSLSGVPAEKKDNEVTAGAARNDRLGQNMIGGLSGPAPPPAPSANNANTSSRDSVNAYAMKGSPQQAAKAQSSAAPQNVPHGNTEVLDVTGAAPMIDTTTTANVSSEMVATGGPQLKGRNSQALISNLQIAKHGQLQRSTTPNTWQDVLTGHKVLSYAVTGSRIFAGSTKGQLFASDDNGTTWTPISVHDGDTHVNGNITLLHFSDAQNGTLSTSAAETWTTSDGGQTWHFE